MNTVHLEYLIEISNSNSMQQASEKLYITPQALGKAMTNLESELGMPLLIRSNNGVRLTINGQWLVELSKKYLHAINERQKNYQRYLNAEDALPEGTLDLLFTKVGLNNNRVYSFISNLATNTPTLQILVNEAPQTVLLNHLKKAQNILGFSYRIKYNGQYIGPWDDEFLWVPLQVGHLYLTGAPNLITANTKSIYLKKAIQYPLCSYGLEENALSNLIYQILRTHVECPNINHYGYFCANIQEGRYATLSTIFENEESPINHIKNASLIKIRDDIQVIFGYVRPFDETKITANEAYFLYNLEAFFHHEQ